jgi:CheY-like chemotaxis protein
MGLNTWKRKRLIFLYRWNFPAPDAFAIGASAQKLAVRRFNTLHWLGVGIIHQAVSKVCVMTDSDDAAAVVVLVVEDETLIRLLANDMLSEAGYRVLEARDGQEALTILEVHADVRALFTDVTMPNLDGLSLAKVVSERWPRIGILLTSGLVAPSELPNGARFIGKPYEPETVHGEIQAVIAEAANIPKGAAPVALTGIPNLRGGEMRGAGALAQPLLEPEALG